MSTFVKGGGVRTPFGKNEFLRSAQDVKTQSYTFAKNTFPAVLIDGSLQKILQPGTVLAKITSGPDAGKVGPFQAAGTQESQTLTKSGTVSGGTFKVTFAGQQTGALAFDITAADLQAAVEALSTVGLGNVTVTGGPLNTGPFTLQYWLQGDQPAVTVDVTALTGSSPGITVATSQAGAAGAIDGRQTAANIVGLNNTFLPWTLLERDVEVTAVYEAAAVQGWCIELDANGLPTPLSNTTAAFMQRGGAAGKGVDITWK